MKLSAADQAIVDDPDCTLADAKKVIEDHSNMRLGATHMNILFVDTFPDEFGNSDFSATGSVCWIGKDATEATVAHEMGHVLLKSVVGVDDSDHSTYPHDVMTKVTERRPYVFRIEHIKEFRRANRCQTI